MAPTSPGQRRAPARLARWLSCAAVAWGAFAFGAVYPWAYWPLAALSAAAGIAGMAATRGRAIPGGTRMLAAMLALVAAVVAAQLLPLPDRLLGAMSPRGIELMNQLDAGFAWQLVTAHGISLDPAATARGLALFAAFGLLLLGLANSLSHRGADRLVWLITWLGIVLAVIGIIQRALSPGEIYGFWTPLMPANPFGPFINRNHFAGWMLMAIPLALGYFCATFSRGIGEVRPSLRDWVLWLSSPDASKAVLAGFAVILMGLALMLTLSRSGIFSLAVAVIVCGYAGVRRQRGALARSAVFASLMLSSLLIVVWAGVDAIAARFAAVDTVALGGRLAIWQGGARMLEDFWLTGSGLNTFGVATLFYPAVVPGHHLREAHNEYLQLAVEGGVLLAIPALAAIIAFVVAVRRRFAAREGSSYWLRLGAVAGVIAIAVQSLVEFSLQIPGNAALFTTLCALALRRSAPLPSHQNLS
jgi:O-antigen ligase